MGGESVAKKRSLESTTTKTTTTTTTTNMNMNMNMNMKMTTTVPTEGGRLHLLLHCVDGCVPYLNPSQLEKHFPPSETPDLWLGLAVRDSCVAPVYGEAAGKKQRKNNPPKPKAEAEAKAKPSDDGTTATTTAATTTTTATTITTTTTAEKGGTNGTKIRGYTFREASPDPWLLPYTRFTVPSFDLRDESTGKTSKNTNNAISVSTPHGKQKLTPDLYVTASLEGLRSHHTVSLFDDVDDNEFSHKRKVKAVTRNHQWFRHLAAAAAAKTSETNGKEEEASPSGSLLWKPILLPHETETASQNPREGRGERTTESPNPVPKPHADDERVDPNPSGLAFVGRWHSGVQLGELLRNGNATPGSSATASVTATATASTSTESIPWKAVLATRSLRDIVEIASTGLINVIGTDLPRKWAKEKLALGLDLAPRGDTASTAAVAAATAAAGTTGGDTKGDTTSDARTTVDERESKRQKVAEESAPLSSVSLLSSSSSSSDAPTAATARKHTALNADGCLDLSDVSFARDPKPLVEGCACFVCRDARFSRAYIHHLVVAKEMVAEILLFGHNLHCLLQLLRAFDSGDPSRGNAVKELVFGQLPL